MYTTSAAASTLAIKSKPRRHAVSITIDMALVRMLTVLLVTAMAGHPDRAVRAGAAMVLSKVPPGTRTALPWLSVEVH